MRRTVLLLLPLFVGPGCRDDGPPAGAPTPPAASLTLEHDFGVIPHGERRAHEIPLDLQRLGGGFVPLRVHLDCSCGHADLRLRGADGKERFVDGAGTAVSLPAAGESLLLRIEIDTARKEAADLKPTQSRGFVMLQALDDPTGSSRVQWPLVVRFGVDAPVELRPLATLDFGRVAASTRGFLATTLRGDERHRDASFGPATASDPRLALEFVKDGEHWLLRANVEPGPFGNHRAQVVVATSIPGYQLTLDAVWKSIPDLEAVPLDKLSFRAVLDREQTEAEATGQFVIVVDHDARRPVEFTVRQLVDGEGRDLRRHFAVRFEPMPDSPRRQRMHVRYLGGLAAGVRASVTLTKDGDRGPFLPIELVLLARKDA
jgi:hypothetical protein